MAIQTINPMAIKKGAQGQKIKSYGTSSNFDAMMDAVSAMTPTATTAGAMYGSSNSAAVLAAAFSGVNQAGAQMSGYGGSPAAMMGGGGTPYLAGGFNGGAKYSTSQGSIGALSDPNAPVVPGTEGFGQMDMINSMNQNNLHLLELQATMQSNMQGWNTKSNILSADHRARMAMIEKFTARG
jgi:hypothetical protein